MSDAGSDMTLDQFLSEWPAGQAELKKMFETFRRGVSALAGAQESFLPRPGVSYSLRWELAGQSPDSQRPLFVMADVVPLGEDELMLSICFFQEDISDPDELGNGIPGGLYGQDGYCFDLEDDEPGLVDYCLARAIEAHAAAGKA